MLLLRYNYSYQSYKSVTVFYTYIYTHTKP
uniref:Uncharacterized protein n=1 Tax=Anguilla anguilla TaxID=7936 RepID=A0A0E9R3P9_ANGAN